MSTPTQADYDLLRQSIELGDNEEYHVDYDVLLEKKIMEIDPEWMNALREWNNQHGLGKWYA